MLLKAFKSTENKQEQPLEKKSYSNYSVCGINAFKSLGNSGLTAYQSWNYYRSIDPVYNGVDYIATEFSEIKPAIYDTKEKIYYDEVDPQIPATMLLKTLKRPNMLDTKGSFMYKLATSFIVTGDIFLIATGKEKQQPKELFYYGSQYFDIQANTADGYAQFYRLSCDYKNCIFSRDEIKFRFYNREKTQELWQIKQFNPSDCSSDLFGFSRLTPLYYQIEQYLQGNIHNSNLLKKGARPSGMLTLKNISNDETKNAIKQQASQFYQGSANAGSIMLFSVAGDEGEVEFKELSLSNKDMDFVELKKMSETAIYKILKIPSTFYDNSASTFNNVAADTFKMYDFSILPLTKRIYKELTNFLMPRYDDTGRYELSFIESSIPALQSRYLDDTKIKVETGLMTVDEGRNMLGLDEWDGDQPLYNPKAKVEKETPTLDNDEIEKEDDEDGKSFQEFKRLMSKQIDENGDPIYTEKEINDIAIENGLLEIS